MKRLYTLIICLGFIQMAQGQVTTNYNAKWFFGINTGLTWQTTDVKNKTNTGWGLTLGKSFNYHTGALVSFDVRGRFLRGFWYGQDRDTTDFIVANQTLSSGGTNYKDSLGYAVNNFQAENYLLNIELVAHANRFRENTRWDPYIFAGLGMNWRQTYGDVLNRDETTGDLNLYNWDVNDLSKSNIKSTQDGVYETALDGNKQDGYNFFLSQSLGFGLGYQVAKAITIGVEHKTTFTTTDAFDGYIASGKYDHDIYHYTNAFIRFRLFGGKSDNTVEENRDENLPPVVQFTQPSMSGTRVSNPNYYVQGDIKNVFDKENVTFTLNGAVMSNFNYNTNSDLFAANITLREGQNTLILSGTNQYGIDSKTTLIIYEPELILPPVVSFIQPSANPTTVSSPGYNVIGNVANVTLKSEVQVLFNGTNRNDFSFNASNGNVTLSTTLIQGTNSVQITGTNSAGSDTKTTTIIYDRVVPKTPPVVYFTDPSSSSVTVGTNTYTIRGKVQNVEAQSGVSFTQNGSSKTNFTFNAASDDFTYNANLGPDQNTFVLTGTNTDGSASATTYIIYKRATNNPPVATIYNPSGSSASVSVAPFNFGGSVTNVTSSSQIKLSHNGANISNFSFNASNGSVTAYLTLAPGNNVVYLTGTNADGTDSDQANIVYTVPQPIQPPVVYFTDPSSSNTVATSNTYTIRGKVLNVDGSQNVTFKKNGTSQSGFSYNASTDDFVSTVTVDQGQNVFELIGTNAAGSSSATTIITVNVPTPKPPIVTISNPNGGSANTNVAQYPFVGSVQNVTTRSQVKMTLNGALFNGFNYNSSTGLVTANINLNEGVNTVLLKGTNIDGTDSKQASIVYTKIVTVTPPVVTFTNPSSSPTNVSNANNFITATVAHVNSPGGVNITHNGSNVSAFTFGSNNLSFSLNLVEGTNVVTVSGTNDGGTDTKSTTLVYTKPVTTPAPVVTFITPAVNPTDVALATYSVKASVLNVNASSDISVKLNGSSISNFNYSTTTKLVTFTANLNEGSNTIEVKGTNSVGSDVKTTSIKYTKPVNVPLPVVTFVSPVKSGSTVSASGYNVKATVLNVNSKNDIVVKLNGGIVKTAINYSTSTKLMQLGVNLIEGNNSIQVTATNSAGSDVETTSIIYKAPPCYKPVIGMVMPNSATYTTDKESIAFSATVANITSASQVSLSGLSGRIPALSYNASTKKVTGVISLKVGVNTFALEATNNCGVDKVTYKVVRTACDAPTLSLNYANVSNNQTTFAPNFTMVLKVAKITSSSQVVVTLNGKTISSTFSLAKGTIEVDYGILVGTSTFKVVVTNSCGSKTYTHVVKRSKSATKARPTVSITSPATSPFTVSSGTYALQFSTTQIIDKAEIIVRVNGDPVAVSFNKGTNSGSAVLMLNSGSNTIKITVQNPVGSASDSTIIVNSGKATGVPTNRDGRGTTTGSGSRGGR